METVAPHADDAIARATSLLDEGGLALVPLDGAYALAADALHDEAVLRLYHALERSADRALPVVVGGFEDVQHVAFATPLARRLADAFWPGPLTMLLRARPWMPDEVTAGGESVMVRAPGAAFTRALARHFGPLAVAELETGDARRAHEMSRAQARLVVDAGPLGEAAETLVDATQDEAKVLREGAIRAAEVVARGR